MPADQHCDLLIVGSGIMGAGVARLVRDALPAARILMLDSGPVLGPIAGQHLHDMPDGELQLRHKERIASGVQGMYVGAEDVADDAGVGAADREPGMYRLAGLGEDADALPAAALAWNTGGMSVHWTAATPAAWGSEIPECIDPESWQHDTAAASRFLHVNADPRGDSPLRTALMGALNDVFGPHSEPGRQVQALPMAVNRDGEGALVRTGPNRIFPAIATGADPHFELRSGAQVMRLLHEEAGGERPGERTVRGAVVRKITTGEEYTVTAMTTVVCADAFRTPQLLFASGIRPTALGRYLNEHIFQTGRVHVDPDAVGLQAQALAGDSDSEWRHTSYWLPHSDKAQSFNGQFSGTARLGADGEIAEFFAGIALYVPTEIQETNRIEFSDTELDALGMPKMRVVFDYIDDDRRLLAEAREAQARAGRHLGRFDPATDSETLPPGTSLHMTGTVRMGPADDGTSVCDPDTASGTTTTSTWPVAESSRPPSSAPPR
ncbi:GMC oxidoreductase [Streptomyces sp. NPDC058293]|uniref:GMC oxidoreductase n=1 Tax=Streptomyces sp. NPDC058293 TaxID=3346429 RepID=UPI0036E8B4A2